MGLALGSFGPFQTLSGVLVFRVKASKSSCTLIELWNLKFSLLTRVQKRTVGPSKVDSKVKGDVNQGSQRLYDQVMAVIST